MYEWIDYLGKTYTRYKDLYGNPVKRTPEDFPYSFDEYVQYKARDFNPYDDSKYSGVYSDRMFGWDHDKYCEACRIAFDNSCVQYFDRRDPKDIEYFLSVYFDKPIYLKAVLKGCNQATGYPYWVFLYTEKLEVRYERERFLQEKQNIPDYLDVERSINF